MKISHPQVPHVPHVPHVRKRGAIDRAGACPERSRRACPEGLNPRPNYG